MTYKTDTDINEISINTDVLVIGGGLTGVKSACEIASSGYKVILAEKGTELGLKNSEDQDLRDLIKKAASDSNIDVFTGTNIVSSAGTPGDYSIWLLKKDELFEKKVGSIVVATDSSIKVLDGEYGLSLSDKILSQSQIESILASDKEKIKGKNIAILAGFAQEGNPIVTQRVLNSVLAMEKVTGCTVFVYINNIKVASSGLERLFKEGRDKGAIYFKLTDTPEITETDENIKVTFIDPVLRNRLEAEHDLIVIEEQITADPINKKLAELLRIDLDSQDFLQKENVHMFPVRTNREGIFVAGLSRRVCNLANAWVDVDNVVLEIKKLLENGTKKIPADKAVIDAEKCTICLTCYRCCPHGAIFWEGDKAVISPIACQGCGICASECPMNAIQLGGCNDSFISDEIKAKTESTPAKPNIIAFCCENSAYEAGLMAESFKMQIPEGLNIIKVPCAGKIDLDFIMSSFAQGADGVLVMTCHNGNCKSEKGNIFAGWRVAEAQSKLDVIGLEKERLAFVTLASNMGKDFCRIVNEMEERLKKLG
ncbi:MAG TPA: hypothetical protein DD405_03880 [Desulfobacteraceae bacterium]|nr:hypothetical protein [Desulfobacteraceae bacterium]